VNTSARRLRCSVGMSTEDAVVAATASMLERAFADLRRQAQPVRVQPIKQAAQAFIFQIDLLQLQINQGAKPAKEFLSNREAIELVSVDCDVPQAGICPGVFLIGAHADEVGHQVDQPRVVIAFHPDHLDVAFGIGKPSNLGEESPVVFVEAGEIEVGEDVTQQNEPSELSQFYQLQRLARPAHVRAKVKVAHDQRIRRYGLHTSVVCGSVIAGR